MVMRQLVPVGRGSLSHLSAVRRDPVQPSRRTGDHRYTCVNA